MQVKVCGLSTVEQVNACIECGADFCGFILNYPKSHRFISLEKAKQLTTIKKKKSKYVGVLVNPGFEELEIFSKLNLDYFQLYGNYTNKDITKIKKKFKKKIIFSIQVKKKSDIMKYKDIEKTADIILWDSSGLEQSLNWNYNWISSVSKNIIKMIAGNINSDKLKEVSKLANIVDVSGALETNKVKDIIKIKKFLNEVKLLND
jgi:phosphoribosylanthranilate isomerase